jgi:hypothetical protein
MDVMSMIRAGRLVDAKEATEVCLKQGLEVGDTGRRRGRAAGPLVRVLRRVRGE